MLVVLLGPPGAGKGTQAEKLSSKYNLVHIATGDMLRAAVKGRTALGTKAKQYMDEGKLVPDNIVVGIVKERLQKPDAARGSLLDGFPRTVNQAQELEDVLEQLGLKLTAIININVEENALIERLTGRRVCQDCGFTYHLKYNPPQVRNVCDRCGGELYQREDDMMETVRKRLSVYEEQTAPLIEHYSAKGLVHTVDGSKEIEDVFADISQVMDKFGT